MSADRFIRSFLWGVLLGDLLVALRLRRLLAWAAFLMVAVTFYLHGGMMLAAVLALMTWRFVQRRRR